MKNDIHKLQKNFLKKFKKTLDKLKIRCYTMYKERSKKVKVKNKVEKYRM